MMVRTQISLETELQHQARERASQIGVSLAEYVRRLVARDLSWPEARVDVTAIFDLGKSGGSNIAVAKDSMIAEAFKARRKKKPQLKVRPVNEPICRYVYLVRRGRRFRQEQCTRQVHPQARGDAHHNRSCPD